MQIKMRRIRGSCPFPPNSKSCDTSEPITGGSIPVRRNSQPETENIDQNEEEQPITGGPAHSEDISSSSLECRSKEQDRNYLRCVFKSLTSCYYLAAAIIENGQV